MTLTIEHRFRGPARSGNGGYTAGSLAALVAGTGGHAVEVTLRMPPPLDTALAVAADGATTRLLDGDAVVAEARLVPDELPTVEAVAPDVAAEAMASYAGLRKHPFPGCFACGTDRGPGDGLQVYPGPVPGAADTVASLWVPHAAFADHGDVVDSVEHVGVAVTWAALDCVGGWAGDWASTGGSRSPPARCTTPTAGSSPPRSTSGSRSTRRCSTDASHVLAWAVTLALAP